MSNEPQRIYDALFGAPIPPVIAARFRAASALLERTATAAELAAYQRVVASAADLEAVELAARYTRRLPLLSRKMQLMAYLAETLPENQDRFINRQTNRVGGLLRAAGAVFRTASKMVAGLLALRQVRP